MGFPSRTLVGRLGTAYLSDRMWDSADFLVHLTAKTATLCCRSDTVDLDSFTKPGTTFSELGFRYDDSGQNRRSLEIGVI